MKEIGQVMQCEACDMIPTADDAVEVRCPRLGRVIREDLGFGHKRLRAVCADHGLTTAYEVN